MPFAGKNDGLGMAGIGEASDINHCLGKGIASTDTLRFDSDQNNSECEKTPHKETDNIFYCSSCFANLFVTTHQAHRVASHSIPRRRVGPHHTLVFLVVPETWVSRRVDPAQSISRSPSTATVGVAKKRRGKCQPCMATKRLLSSSCLFLYSCYFRVGVVVKSILLAVVGAVFGRNHIGHMR